MAFYFSKALAITLSSIPSEILVDFPRLSSLFVVFSLIVFLFCFAIPDSIKVGVFGALTPSGCSPSFEVEMSTVGANVDLEDVATPWVGHLETKEACDPTISFDVSRNLARC